ncbi:MAG: transposase [Planctomycetota bacterium]|jgi:REP element-mobilizing transposase RayT
MSRATRIEFPGAIYHVMSRTVEGTEAFKTDSEKRSFLSILGEIVEGGDLEVHAFCLMWNHFHLLVATPRANLARWMHRLLGLYAQRINHFRKRSGHLWQGRYKAILVEAGPHLLECSRYIHLNPTRASGRPAESWKWSSYRNYVGGLGKPVVSWIQTSRVLRELEVGTLSKKAASARFRKYTEEAKGREVFNPFDRAVAGLALGSEAFVGWMKERLGERKVNEDEPSLRQIRFQGLFPVSLIENLVRKEWGEPRKKGVARRVLMFCLSKYSELRPAAVARELGVTRSAVSRSVSEVLARSDKDKDFRASVNRFVRSLGKKPKKG